MKFLSANRIAQDGTPCFAASHPGLLCLPLSHKRDARLISSKSSIANIVHKIYTFTGCFI